ncbi:MAG TPA: AAA family ATPase [Candidatus Dojkabacteria bacterium]|nr:AAA family ATPase [Candidatus Dojkabacteria bacterium]
MRAIIFGIGGVGKTSVVDEVVKAFPIERLLWGTYAVEMAKQEKIINENEYDQLRKQNTAVQKRLQLKVAKLFADKMNAAPDKNFLIETHAALKTPQGYFLGCNFEILQLLKPDLIIVVSAIPDLILKRRAQDPSRTRKDDRTVAEVAYHLNLTSWLAASFAAISGAVILEVENKEGDIPYAANIILATLKSFMQKEAASV